jgi:hypothetical protein
MQRESRMRPQLYGRLLFLEDDGAFFIEDDGALEPS